MLGLVKSRKSRPMTSLRRTFTILCRGPAETISGMVPTEGRNTSETKTSANATNTSGTSVSH